MGIRRQKDWERIEPGWRAGIKSVLQLAADYEAETGDKITHTAINKHFKKIGVLRNFSPENIGRFTVQAESNSFDGSGFIYVIYLEDSAGERFYKIGMAKTFHSRLAAHQCSSPFDIFISCAYFVANMRAEETHLHKLFIDKKVKGEWFKLEAEDLSVIATRSVIG